MAKHLDPYHHEWQMVLYEPSHEEKDAMNGMLPTPEATPVPCLSETDAQQRTLHPLAAAGRSTSCMTPGTNRGNKRMLDTAQDENVTAPKSRRLLEPNVDVQENVDTEIEDQFPTRRYPWIQQLLDNAEERTYTRAEVNAFFQAFGGKRKRILKPAGPEMVNLKGMKSDLYLHQLIGAACMMLREKAESVPRGGILGDQMGLGKTVMTLAIVVAARQLDTAARKAPTLIVASPALAAQWWDETDKHCHRNALGGVMKHFGRQRIDTSDNLKILMKHGVVLTTYNEVLNSHEELDGADETAIPKRKSTKGGLLHRVPFHRIVLDEAAKIKNLGSKTSKACRALKGTCHWALSGTIVTNGPQEYFPIFHFLRVPGIETIKDFVASFYDGKTPNERFTGLLKQITISRQGKTKILGKEILSLPPRTEEELWIKQSGMELDLYHAQSVRINKAIAKTLQEKAKLLNTEIAIESTINTMVKSEYLPKASLNSGNGSFELQMRFAEPSTEVAKRISKACALMLPLRMLAANTLLATHLPTKFLTDSEVKKLIHEQCGESQPFSEEDVNIMLKLFRESEKRVAVAKLNEARKESKGMFRPHSKKSGFLKTKNADSNAKSGHSKGTEDSVKKKRRKTKRIELAEWLHRGGKILENAKTRQVKTQVATWIEEDPTKKILIFTEWTDEIRILGRICDRQGWGYRSYHGKLSQETRRKAIDELRDKPECMILLISLGAGSEGLNLTSACRLISMDPWFTSAKEEQAFGRIYRIGQTKETNIVRILASGTVDSRLIAMQKHKRDLIDGVIRKGADGSNGLNHKDLYAAYGEALGFEEGELEALAAEDTSDEEDAAISDDGDDDVTDVDFDDNSEVWFSGSSDSDDGALNSEQKN